MAKKLCYLVVLKVSRAREVIVEKPLKPFECYLKCIKIYNLQNEFTSNVNKLCYVKHISKTPNTHKIYDVEAFSNTHYQEEDCKLIMVMVFRRSIKKQNKPINANQQVQVQFIPRMDS